MTYRATGSMADATDVSTLPVGWDGYAGYSNGAYANIPSIRARFPGSPIKTISVWGIGQLALTSDIADCESGDYQPTDAAQWAQLKINGNLGRPTIYSSTSVYPDLVAALALLSLQFGVDVDWWEAHYDNTPSISTLPGAIGKQFQSSTFDSSIVYLDWLIPQSANRPDLTVSTF